MSLFNKKDPDPPEVHILGDDFSQALIGHNVSVHGPPRVVYSLVLLTNIVRKKAKITEEQAMARVSEMVKASTKRLKDAAPVFVDDSISRISRTPAKEKSGNRIITRGGRR